MSRYWKFKSDRDASWETRGDIVWNLEIDCESLMGAQDLCGAEDVVECDEFGKPLALLEKEGER